MTQIETDKYEGYALYCNDKKPLGVISSNGDRRAICNNETLPNKFKKYLISIEDHRFYEHGAIDFKGISRAFYENIKAGKVVQGGSTITQQLARNILGDNRKTITRKLREISLALKLENKYSKDEILELYFNNVFWGKKIYGLRTASLEYFSKEPEQLNTSEQIALLTFLRGPNYYLKNESKFFKRHDFLTRALGKREILSSKKVSKIRKTKIQIHSNNLEVFRSASVPYISESVNKKKHSILSTLNKEIQQVTTEFIASCKYPTSIIGYSSGQVVTVASSNGTDYPFTFKTNVGSTLKPLIYSFLRENGVADNQLFPTSNIYNLNWDIREVQKSSKAFLSLKEALVFSNNNVFVNASYQFGIEKILSFLAKATNKSANTFVPASILGASIEGITLNELANTYYKFFLKEPKNNYRQECISILKEIAIEKFDGDIYDIFLKTGTTNNNRERYAIIGDSKTVFAFLRQEDIVGEYSKEGGLLNQIKKYLKKLRKKNTNYKWII